VKKNTKAGSERHATAEREGSPEPGGLRKKKMEKKGRGKGAPMVAGGGFNNALYHRETLTN